MNTSRTTQNSELADVTQSDIMQACGRGRYQAHDFLLSLIRRSGKTQKEIAKIADMDEGALSRILRRPQNYEINTICKIIHAACGAYLELNAFLPNSFRKSASEDRTERIFIVSQNSDLASDEPVEKSAPDTGSVVLNSASNRVREKRYA